MVELLVASRCFGVRACRWRASCQTQPAEKGAYPTVLAAAASNAQPGACYGPTAMSQMHGPVGKSFIAPGRRMRRSLERSAGEELVGPSPARCACDLDHGEPEPPEARGNELGVGTRR